MKLNKTKERIQVVSLADMNVGEKGRVIFLNSPIQKRLFELGLTEGSLVECVLRPLFSDPAAYLIRGAVIAIRSRDCKNIMIEPVF